MSRAIQLVDLGFDEIDGDPARGCIHIAQWWPWFRLLVKLKTGVDLNKQVVQFTGNYAGSAGTHDGPTWDGRTYNLSVWQRNEIVSIAREAGARATYYRPWKNNTHIHSALDCPCVSGSDYQTRAADRRRNALADNGPDPHPAPGTRRDWQTGLSWLKKEILDMSNNSIPTASDIAAAVLAEPFTANGKTAPLSAHLASSFVDTRAQSLAVQAEKERDYAERDRDGKIMQAIAALEKKVDALKAGK